MHRILAFLSDDSTCSSLCEWVESGDFEFQIVECFEDVLAAFAAGTFDTVVVDEAAQVLDRERRKAMWEAVSDEARVYAVGGVDLSEFDDAHRVDDVDGLIEALKSQSRASDAMDDRPESGKYFVSDTQGRPCLGGIDSRAQVQTDGLHREISHIDAAQVGAPWVLYVGPADTFRRSLVQASPREKVELSVADHPRALNLSEGEAPLGLVIFAVEGNLGEVRRAIRYLRRRQPENTFEVLLLDAAEQPVSGGLARSLGADEVIDRSADPADILQRARGGRTTAEHVSMLVFSSNSERFPLFEAALAREPVDVVFASEIDTAEDAFETWSPHLVLVDRTETAEDSRALLEQLRHSDPFSPTRFVRVADSGDTLAGGELGGRGEFFDEMLCAPLSWADIRRTVRRQIAHVNYGKMRLEKDSLTGVRSALVLAEHLQSCLDEAHHHGDSVMLTGLDVDELDEINERYGRSVGDSVLRSLADSLYLAVGSRELIYRTPADEFFVLQRVDSKDWYDARDRLDSALRVFQKQTFRAPDGRGTYATATGGTVVVPPVRVSAEVCLEKCWIVLDRSMRSRRSRLLVAQLDPSMLPEREPSRDRADERE